VAVSGKLIVKDMGIVIIESMGTVIVAGMEIAIKVGTAIMRDGTKHGPTRSINWGGENVR
jgi:hypothetical protein